MLNGNGIAQSYDYPGICSQIFVFKLGLLIRKGLNAPVHHGSSTPYGCFVLILLFWERTWLHQLGILPRVFFQDPDRLALRFLGLYR